MTKPDKTIEEWVSDNWKDASVEQIDALPPSLDFSPLDRFEFGDLEPMVKVEHANGIVGVLLKSPKMEKRNEDFQVVVFRDGKMIGHDNAGGHRNPEVLLLEMIRDSVELIEKREGREGVGSLGKSK